jgi:hypothetical protein
MTPRKPAGKKSPRPDLIRTHSLTPEAAEILQQLAQDATDRLGWTVSSSAVVRALIRYADQQGTTWAEEQLFPLIGQEIEAGTVWGKKK